ncbi:MAG TPA: tripartite tricarboxylate transporter permease [Chloroflexota bacterium]
MEIIQDVAMGFSIALQPINLLYCFIGVFAGTLIGVLPGIGPVTGVAILIPITFGMNPTTAIIMLAGIYYGAMYGGSTTSILVNVPGESASVMTAVDGYQMARKGRAGAALGMSAIGSFIAGTFSVIGLMLIAGPVVTLALSFGPPEYFALMLLGLSTLTRLAGKSLVKGLTMGILGMLIGTVGLDPIAGVARFTFGRPDLMDGIGFVSVAMGLFAFGEILTNLEGSLDREVFSTKIGSVLPTVQDWIDCKWTLVRSTLVGFFIGALPGAGATVAAFMAYAVEKKASKHPERFGQGAIEGVCASESANNSATGGALVPLLTLGIPSSATVAILMGALMMNGLRPGPLLMTEHPDFFWGLIASMYVGNIMLLVLNLPMIGLWVKILKVPYPVLIPLILLFVQLGAYTVGGALSDLWIMFAFGIVGYLMRKFDYPAAPLVLALVLGPIMEKNLKLALTISQGSPLIFLQRPISIALIALTLLSLGWPVLVRVLTRGKAVVEVPVAEEV